MIKPDMASEITSGTILWLTGWSMPETVFDRLQFLLPDFHHVTVDYSNADTPEDIVGLVERAARNCLSYDGGALLIAGWSLGGLLALGLAVEGLADGLVMLGATARFTRSKEQLDLGWPDAYIRQMMASIIKDRQATETKFRRTIFTDAEREAGFDAKLPPAGSWSTLALIAGLHVLRSKDYLSQLSGITCPVLLAHGLEDKVCPYGAAEELVTKIPQAKLITIDYCGHVPFLEREAELAEAIRKWWHGRQAEHDSTTV